MAGLNERLTAEDSKLLDGQAVTSTATGSAVDFGNGQLGAIEIVTEVATEVTIASGQRLQISIKDELDAIINEVYDSGVVTAVTTLEAGTVLGLFVLPTDTDSGVKGDITTATAGGAGTINMFGNYLAR